MSTKPKLDGRNVLAIDPGYAARGEGCACALYAQGFLQCVWFERPESAVIALGSIHPIGVVVVEKPQGDKRSMAVPIDVLIELSWQGAALAYTYAAVNGAAIHCPKVRDWKGNEAKPQQHRRLWKALSEGEREVLGGNATGLAIEKACIKGALKRWDPKVRFYPESFLTHNLLDAAALGAKTIGRLT